jgi:hypothetical protein
VIAVPADNRPSVAARGDASFRGGDMGSGWGSPVTIKQEAARLTIEYVFFSTYDLQPPLRYVYTLDGSESRNSVMVGHSALDQRSRVAWQGNTLVITTLHPVPDGETGRTLRAEVRQALTLEAPGTLVVETTRVGIRGAATTVTRTAYTKR